MGPYKITTSMIFYSAMSVQFISAETALELARRILSERFAQQADVQEPLTVRAEAENWIVEGRPLDPVPSLPLEIDTDMRYVMVVAQFDGQIKDIVFHGPPIDPEAYARGRR